MTRIDNVSSLQDREALKKEIRHEIRGEERRKKLAGFGGCVLLLAVFVGVPAFMAALFLAKTGFVDVPLLSNAFYRPSAPVRDVVPLKGMTADQVMKELEIKAMRGYDPLTSRLSLPVGEQELTTVMQDAVALSPGSLPFSVNRLQAVIEPDVVEIYAVTPQHGRDVTVRMSFKPEVHGGILTVVAPNVVLGNQAVPKMLAQPLFNFVAKSLMDKLGSSLGPVGTLSDIKLSGGVMTFVFYRQ